jgi:hypothetical protein
MDTNTVKIKRETAPKDRLEPVTMQLRGSTIAKLDDAVERLNAQAPKGAKKLSRQKLADSILAQVLDDKSFVVKIVE